MKLGNTVKPIESKTGIKYKLVEYAGGGYFKLKNGDKEMFDHVDNLRKVGK